MEEGENDLQIARAEKITLAGSFNQFVPFVQQPTSTVIQLLADGSGTNFLRLKEANTIIAGWLGGRLDERTKEITRMRTDSKQE